MIIKTMLEIAAAGSLWLLGAGTFFHVWCRRGGKYFASQSHNVSEGWYVHGWSDGDDPWYDLGTAMGVSLFLWLPLSLIIGIKYSILGSAFVAKKGFEKTLPPKMRQEPPLLVRNLTADDPFMLAAINEVEAIAPDDHKLPVRTPSSVRVSKFNHYA
jgi:hypothetical protein